jgi:hypothetical protein
VYVGAVLRRLRSTSSMNAAATDLQKEVVRVTKSEEPQGEVRNSVKMVAYLMYVDPSPPMNCADCSSDQTFIVEQLRWT